MRSYDTKHIRVSQNLFGKKFKTFQQVSQKKNCYGKFPKLSTSTCYIPVFDAQNTCYRLEIVSTSGYIQKRSCLPKLHFVPSRLGGFDPLIIFAGQGRYGPQMVQKDGKRFWKSKGSDLQKSSIPKLYFDCFIR